MRVLAGLRLFSPAVALLLWALTWELGVQGDGPQVAWLTVTGVTVLDHIEQARFRERG
jgi:uncharacterized membrane protein